MWNETQIKENHHTHKGSGDLSYAGEEGIEPSHGGFKGPCLTAWLLPNRILVFGYDVTTKHTECLVDERIFIDTLTGSCCLGLVELDNKLHFGS